MKVSEYDDVGKIFNYSFVRNDHFHTNKPSKVEICCWS